ncbi:MFS transporter [Bradyrhizobium sp. dw_78]|uniref:MFS transporter n=1 Tax=Bradyrhizobium sp. dw_78 TaxID=2719793 RepID=UPI001BD3C77E|nr:MFS transporter [Bradyrhizobium sp. dw_78]
MLKFRVFGLFALGYFISYLLRGLNIGFAPFLMRELHLSAIDLGTLTSFHFLGFAIAQIPGGLLLDRYGPRRVNAALLLLGALGVLIFGLAPNFPVMLAGRFLIGVGVSATLGGAFKALAQHFPLQQLPLLNGMTMAVGGLGGVAVGSPLTWLLGLTDWRSICVALAMAVAVAAIGLWFGVTDIEHPHRPGSIVEQLTGMRHILGSAVFWKIASFSGLTQGVFYGMQSLWAGAFMRDVSGFDAGNAAALVSILGLAMMAGSVGFGALARRLDHHSVSLHSFCGAGMAVFLLDQILILLRVPLPATLLWTLYGAFGGIGFLSFADMARHFSLHLIGRANAAFNLVIFLLVFAAQIGVGAVLNLWPAAAGHYPAQAHLIAWSGLVLLQLLGSVWYFWPGKPIATS